MLSPAKITVRSDDGSIPFRKKPAGRWPCGRHQSSQPFQERGAGAPSGRGAMTGDPAANSATSRADSLTTGTATRSNHGGSGTSTSGGKDDNGGDKMPESNRTVRPESQPHHPEDK